jgi:hypothetical protein
VSLWKCRAELEADVIAVDGKALRRSHNGKAGLGPLFFVSAWAVQRGISLGELATAEKSNEITAFLVVAIHLRRFGASPIVAARVRMRLRASGAKLGLAPMLRNRFGALR